MPDYPAERRRALEMLAAWPEGVTDAALAAHGFEATTIAGLVKSGFATSNADRVWAGRREVEVRWLRLTPAGRKALRR
jgi:hypothetical protein